MRMMKNKLELIKKHRKSIGVCGIFAIFFFFLLIQQQGLYMQHDDFAYGCLSYGIGYTENARYYGIEEIVKYLIWHYENWGGRVTFYFIMIVLLRLGIHAVRVFQVLVLFLTAVCTYWILRNETGTKKSMLLAVGACLMYGFYGLTVFSDGVMWIAAASTYIWAVPFFLSGLCMDISYHKDGKKAKLAVACLLYAFAASSQEQIAVLTIAVTGLRYLNSVFEQICTNGRKLTKAIFNIHFILLGCAILGGAFEILAPGNFGRMESDANAWFYELSFGERLLNNVDSLLYTNFGVHNHMMFFVIILGGIMASIVFVNWYRDKKKICVMHGINLLIGIAFLAYAVCRYRANALFLSSHLVEGFVFVWFSSNLGWLLYKTRNKVIGFLYIGGLCSQLMMLVSPTITIRTSIPMGTMLQISIVCIVIYFYQEIKNYFLKLIPIVLFGCAIWNLQNVTNGFLQNAVVHEYNKNTIEEFGETDVQTSTCILLAKMRNDAYANQQPYHQSYVEVFLRWYYNIPDDIEIIYSDYDTVQAYYDGHVGTSLETALNANNISEDGWVQQNGSLIIKSGKQGKFILETYDPNWMNHEDGICNVYANGKLIYEMKANEINSIVLDVEPETSYVIRFESDYYEQEVPPGKRKLCFVLAKIVGE